MARPVTIELRHVHKQFARPGRVAPSLGTRLRDSLKPRSASTLRVLEDISFDVHRGETIGLVGRNGSGKSTLLKLIASIYRADRGSIRVAGRLAPLIELGVGFRPDLAARDNVVLNGVMMGLTAAEARRRFDAIIAFAGLEDYTDLKLKNYSSGMKGRLGFAVMIHVDADVLLIDEILAVGDKAFREKCGDVFTRLREQGKTIVLVSHEMGSINRWCDRAMLLSERKIEHIGEPRDVADRYLKLNAMRRLGEVNAPRRAGEAAERPRAEIVELELRGEQAGARTSFRLAEALELEAIVELNDRLARASFGFQIQDQSGRQVFVAPPRELVGLDGSGPTGSRLRVRATIENRLAPGGYALACVVAEGRSQDAPVSPVKWTTFDVAGGDAASGVITLDHEVWVESAAPVEAPRV